MLKRMKHKALVGVSLYNTRMSIVMIDTLQTKQATITKSIAKEHG